MKRNNVIVVLLIALWVGGWVFQTGRLPASWLPSSRVDRVTYVFEKDLGGVPAPVSYALRKLNEQNILATELEVHPENGLGQVPAQDRVAVAVAGDELPMLVVQSGETVLKLVKSPTTVAHVAEAAGIVIEEPQ